MSENKSIGIETTSSCVKNYRYAASKKKEINKLINCIKNPVQTKLVFQYLPRHMRRRTMTHNVKRLPRKLRAAHTAQMHKSGIPQRTKRPSRKFRRKPSNLMKEYIRRQQNNIWLETHIWHAKRFHMTNRWGYRLALAPCDKNFRACYRATSKHCLLQDISYLGCIEISAPIEIIKESFQKITNHKCGLSVTAKIYVNGLREGKLDIFKINSYPYNSLGSVSFIWLPDQNDDKRKIWIFVHPAFYKEFLSELIRVFELKLIVKTTESVDKTMKNIPKTYNFDRTPIYENTITDVHLIELKDTLNRFRLTGPLSQTILNKAFKLKPVDNPSYLNAHECQSKFWKSLDNLTSTAELPPNMALALNIEDPRLNRPKKRNKPSQEITLDYESKEIPNNSNISVIWNTEFRNKLLDSMISTNELCKLRNECNLVPGENSIREGKLQSVPILLIQRPGSQRSDYKRIGYGSGWDIIIPGGYGISTWMCLIMWGARAGGLRESKSILRESGIDEFLPDTIGGLGDCERKYKELKDSYFSKPQNKRQNYNKFAISSPFKCPFLQLTKEWSVDSNIKSFYVLREFLLLEKLQLILNRKMNINSIELPSNALIPVYISMQNRGCAKDNSIVCIPKKIDLVRYFKKKKYLEPIFEPLRSDPNEIIRKKLRKSHLILLKRLRNQRIRVKRKLQQTSEVRVKIMKPQNDTIISEQYKKMCSLWLNENPEKIRNQCSREVFGYVTQAEFSYTDAKGTAIGYVTWNGFKKFVITCKNYNKFLCLIRSPGTRNYRWIDMKIRML